MSKFGHWSPRYLRDRTVEYLYQKRNPKLPWLTKTANIVFDSYLKKSDVGLEFGSGRSTAWFADKTKHMTSVEHHEGWYHKVDKMFIAAGIQNIDYHLIPIYKSMSDPNESPYVRIVDKFENKQLDFALVDGAFRGHCALNAIDKICPGGMLVIDNVNWFLPSDSVSPSSRSMEDGPNGEVWQSVHEIISDWRRLWTSSGVNDTAFFFKPH